MLSWTVCVCVCVLRCWSDAIQLVFETRAKHNAFMLDQFDQFTAMSSAQSIGSIQFGFLFHFSIIFFSWNYWLTLWWTTVLCRKCWKFIFETFCAQELSICWLISQCSWELFFCLPFTRPSCTYVWGVHRACVCALISFHVFWSECGLQFFCFHWLIALIHQETRRTHACCVCFGREAWCTRAICRNQEYLKWTWSFVFLLPLLHLPLFALVSHRFHCTSPLSTHVHTHAE